MKKSHVPQKMRRTSTWSVVHMLSLILFFCTILILSSPYSCSARDTIPIQSGLVDGQTLVSAGNIFELGFFSPSRISNVKRYVGIWYTSTPEIVVWVANREKPLSDYSGVLSITDNNLKLSDGKGNPYWSTQLTAKGSNLVAQLNDTGNLILLDDGSRETLWESFKEPTDTFLFGMKMDENFKLTSWTSKEDPEPGNFTFKQDPEGTNQFVVMNKSIAYWRSSRRESAKIFRSDEMPSTIVDFFNFFRGNIKISFNFSGNNTKILKNKRMGVKKILSSRMVINLSGDLQYWQLDTDTKSWSLIWWEPKERCSVFNFCGDFGACNVNNKVPCKCLPGFKPKLSEKWNASDFSDGCSRDNAACGKDFLRLKKMKVGYTSSWYEAKGETDCRQECLSKCQCQAYSYVVQSDTQRDTKISCFTWTEDLNNLQEDQDGDELYVRLVLSDIGNLPFT